VTWQFEIPSIEHPDLLAAVIDEAQKRGVSVGRVSMGGGTQLLTDSELREMTSMAHQHAIDVYCYASRRNSYEPTVDPLAGEQIRGQAMFEDAVRDVEHCLEHGVDGVLLADVGLLSHLGGRRQDGTLGELGLKTAAAIAPQNAASAQLYERLGATSINAPPSAGLADLEVMRSALSDSVTLDIYVEAPMELGGALRYGEVAQIVDRLAPVYLKIGLRNAPALYPYGAHLRDVGEQCAREKIRRAELTVERLQRMPSKTIQRAVTTAPGDEGTA
jgi:hypothetical protein